MALTPYTTPTNIIGTLGTDPEDRSDLDDQGLKDKFDQNAMNIVGYINGTMLPEVETVKIVPVAASKTLALTDAYTMQECEHATIEIVNTIPNISFVSFPAGTQIAFSRDGAAEVSFALASGVTISNTTKRKIANQGDSAVLIYKGSNAWKLYGSMKA
jgi:hypothetical protein